MVLTPGTEIGHYRIVEKLGAGGMGEVYLAVDTKLNRRVALKFLPLHLCQDEDCRKRFTREAQAAAKLDHPNIAAIHEVGEYQGRPFFAMQVIEGRSLRDVIAGKDLPLENILEIAIQVSEGLQAAHDKGIIHRDIKPSNILLDSHGRVRIVDFGLAAVRGSEQLTKTGSTIGTIGYMSPEQVRGDDIDKRSDLFSLGVVLYELLTKHNPFGRDTEAATLKAVIDDLPEPLARFKAGLPDRLQLVVEKALEKDVKTRYQHADGMLADLMRVRRALESGNISGFKSASERRTGWRLAWLAAAVFAVVAAFLAWKQLAPEKTQPQSFRFTIPKPEGVVNVDWPQPSPDGRYLAFLGYDSLGTSRIWLLPLDSARAFPLPETTVPAGTPVGRPFWSPDSKHLAVYDVAEGRLKKLSIEGGTPSTICRANFCDGTWGSSGTILCDDFNGRGIGRVQASGGEATLAAWPDTAAGETYISWPSFLPDGRHFIYNNQPMSWSSATDELYLKIGSLDSRESRHLGKVVGRAVYCEPGYLMYLKNGFLVMHRFNAGNLEFEGTPIPLTAMPTSSVSASVGLVMNAGVSNNGIVAWKKGPPPLSRLVWVDRNGKVLDTVGPSAIYGDLRLSPDNRYVAYHARPSEIQGFKISIMDLQNGRVVPLTTNSYSEWYPVWSPEGDAIAFCGFADSGATELEYCRLQNSTSISLIRSDSSQLWPVYWSAGNELLLGEFFVQPQKNRRMYRVKVDQQGVIEQANTLPDRQTLRGVSPDGRYGLSQTNNAVWLQEVYAFDINAPEHRWRITASGRQPRWSPTGKEIFFFDNDDFMVVEVDTANGLRFGVPRKLFTRRQFPDWTITLWGYDVSNDGQRFLFITPVDSPAESSGDIEVIVNWPAAYGVNE